MDVAGAEGGRENGIGRIVRTQEIEPYFVARIKTSSPTSDLLSPQISPAPFAPRHSCVTVTRLPGRIRCTTRSLQTSTASTSTRFRHLTHLLLTPLLRPSTTPWFQTSR